MGPQINYTSLLWFINTSAVKSLYAGFQMESKVTLGTEICGVVSPERIFTNGDA